MASASPTEPGAASYDVYISYPRDARAWAQRLYSDLTGLGLRCFIDLELRAGEPWNDSMAAALDDTTALLVLWTPEAADSKGMLTEIAGFEVLLRRDDGRRRLLIPLFLGQRAVKTAPASLSMWQGVILDADVADEPSNQVDWQNVIAAVQSAVREGNRVTGDPAEPKPKPPPRRSREAARRPEPPPAPAGPPPHEFDLVASAAGDLPSTEDLLGYGPLVRALHALLDDPKTALPLAIAVTAPWGAGKSSVMRQLQGLLEGRPAAADGGERRATQRNWRTVRFDAWKYERSERLWAALAKAIYDQSQEGMSWREKVVFRLRLERRRLGLWKLAAVTLAPLLIAATAVTAALSADLPQEGGVVAGLSAAALILGTASHYGEMIVNPFRRAIEKHAARPDYEAQLGFTAEADREIRKLVALLAPSARDGLAVFVDDLDRCSSAHVVEVVEAMNQIFNAADDHRCVFVLGLDQDVVATNISVAYGATVAQLTLDGNALGKRFGTEFLAKLVQLSVAIPPPDPVGIHRLMKTIVGAAPAEAPVSETDVRRAQEQIRRKADGGLQSVEVAAEEVAAGDVPAPAVEEAKHRERARRLKDSPAVVDAEFAALDFLAPNPRQVKRFHNAFRLQLYVASEDDRVTFDFSPDQLVALARWVALRLRWPSLADAIAREPDLLAALEAAANGARAPNGSADVRERHAAWLGDPEVMALIREVKAGRRLSALRLDAFVRIA